MSEFKQELFPGWLPLQLAHFYDFPLTYGEEQSIAVNSLGGREQSPDIHSEMEAALKKSAGQGIIVFAATGDSGYGNSLKERWSSPCESSIM
ncbi:hypothetical protein CI610_01075 [invertebrate metagenome]|uniref:Uncharacterized protein n=1 Tax=invertebrate metagenome TaxID=1711999 RepID=A0A2H9T9S3_9ZZZZ